LSLAPDPDKAAQDLLAVVDGALTRQVNKDGQS